MIDYKKKKNLEEYYAAMGLTPPSQAYLDGSGNLKQSERLSDYQKVAADQTQSNEQQPQTPEQPSPKTQPTTTTPSNRPQSWNGLKMFLQENIDNARDWDAENIMDYSILNNAIAEKKLSNDQRAEGQILFQNYLSDIQAQSTYNQALARAENQARKDTALNNAMAERVASYIREVQGGAGFEGYEGVTKGQAISLANMQASSQQDIQNAKATAQQEALQAYQDAALENSRNFSDQYGTLMAARDEKADTNYQNYLSEVQLLLDTYVDDNGKITEANYQKAKDYINGLDTTANVKTRVNDYIDALYGNKILNSTNAASDALAKVDSFTDGGSYKSIRESLDEYKSQIGEAKYNEYIDKLNEKMDKWVKNTVRTDGKSKTLVETDDIDVIINGKTFDLVAGKIVKDDTIKSKLNEMSTGSTKNTPGIGYVLAYNGDLYIYKESRKGDNWHKMGDDHDKVTDAVNALNAYAK